MQKLTWNVKYFWDATPKIIKQIRVGLVSFIGGSLIYTGDIAAWLKITEHTLTTVEGLVLLSMTALLNMFGVKPDDSQPASITTTVKKESL